MHPPVKPKVKQKHLPAANSAELPLEAASNPARLAVADRDLELFHRPDQLSWPPAIFDSEFAGSEHERLAPKFSGIPQGNVARKLGEPNNVVELAPKRRERQKKQRSQNLWRNVRRIGIVTAISAVGAAGIWLVAFSPFLALSPGQVEVEFQSESLIDESQIQALFDDVVGTPLVLLPLGQLEQDILQFPQVLSAQVTRSWPVGLHVMVEPRVPAAAVPVGAVDVLRALMSQLMGDSEQGTRIPETRGYAWVDQTGVVIGHFTDSGDLPRISAPANKPEVITAALAIWSALPTSLSDQVTQMSAATTDNVTAHLTSGQKVILGSAEQLNLKIATAQALLVSAPKPTIVDVSSPSLPVTR
jgi:cell division protein FtsQ